ncbi:MAG: asparaginyl-tRNA synthetase [Sclerophora amabilis]|nr:MAG: asparaginyl-tRNA synthetase [Sclerophora amabilis]
MLKHCFNRPLSSTVVTQPHGQWLARRSLARDQHSASLGSSSSRHTIAALLASPSGLAENESVVIQGFVRSVRKHKRVSFAAIGDGSTIKPLQVVLSPIQAQDLTNGIAVTVHGAWKQSALGKDQSHEVHATDVKILSSLDPTTYPLQNKYHTVEYLRTIPHLRSRTNLNSLFLRLRSQSIARLSSFLASQDFIQTHPPIITSSDCEGAGEVFGVARNSPKAQPPGNPPQDAAQALPFFGDPKYLTVSSQLHLEALAQSVSRVWTLSPTFRAERSDTARHLSEFYMLEVELSFSDDLEQIMALLEGLVRDLVVGLRDSQIGQELLSVKRMGEADGEEGQLASAESLEQRWQGLADDPWPRITYTQAMGRLTQAFESEQATFQFKPTWLSGFQAEHERFIAETVGRGRPVFVTDYPRRLKPFYMTPSSESQGPTPEPTVSCFDLLLPEVCEIAGGSMREHRLRELLSSMHEHGLIKGPATTGASEAPPSSLPSDEELGSLKWYVELRRWGSVPHGGFGLGFDRLLGYLAGVPNIREIVTFPRWIGRCDC